MKLNVLLAKRQHAIAIFKKLLADYVEYFKRKDSPFEGYRKSYTPRGDNPIDYNLVGNKRVVSTVNEKLLYFEEHAAPYINHMLSVEATNATAAKAELKVKGKTYLLSTMELLALKSLLETKEVLAFYQEIPARSEVAKWDRSADGEYKTRDIYTTEPIKGEDKTSEVTEYILEDPNVGHLTDTSKYVPIKTSKRVDKILGDKLVEFFTGAIAHQERADMLARRSQLYEDVLEAIENANTVEAIPSLFTAEKLFDFLHRDQ